MLGRGKVMGSELFEGRVPQGLGLDDKPSRVSTRGLG